MRQRAIDEGRHLPQPTRGQLTWQECQLGLIYHFDLPVAAGRFASNNTVRETLDPNLYQPHLLDTDQWLSAAQACGAHYAIFTATHFNGFMQWQSDLYPYGLKQTSWRGGKGDVVGQFVESCRRAGIQPGIYLSCHRNVYWKLWNYYVDWGRGRGTEEQARYNRIAERMTEELCSRYGPLVELWYDAGVKTPAEGGPDVLPIVEKHQPNIVFYSSRQRADHRWIGNEKGYAGEPCWATMPAEPGELSHNSSSWRKCLLHGDPDGRAWSPGMVDVPFRGAHGVHNWFWAPNQDHAVYSCDQLMKMYDQSVGRNANFIIGEVITNEGLVPESDIARLKEFGSALRRRYGSPVAETAGVGAELLLEVPEPSRIDGVIIGEEIAHGERVREYALEGQVADREWQELARGESIGCQRNLAFAPSTVSALRVRVLRATATPIFRRLAAFKAGKAS